MNPPEPPAPQAPTTETPPFAVFARGCLVPILALMTLISSCLIGDAFTGGAFHKMNPMSAVTMMEHGIINQTGDTLRLTPIDGRHETSFYVARLEEANVDHRSFLDKLGMKDIIDAPVAPGATFKFVFDWDDMTLTHFVVKTSTNELYQLDVDDIPRTDMVIDSIESLEPITPAVKEAYERRDPNRPWRVLITTLAPPVLLSLYVVYEVRLRRKRLAGASRRVT